MRKFGAATIIGIGMALGACASTPSAPATSWGKAEISLTQFRLDMAQCEVEAEKARTGNVATDPSRIDAGTASADQGGGGQSDAAALNAAGPSSVSGSSTGGFRTLDPAAASAYNQAARVQDMRSRRVGKSLRDATYRSCLAERGYKEFQLTAEQAARLSALKADTDEGRSYLHSLSSDPAVIDAQAL